MKKALERTIYDENDNLYSEGSWNDAIEYLCDCEGMQLDEITDNDVWNVLYDWDNANWEEAETELRKYFDDSGKPGFILTGYIGAWDGKRAGGFVFRDWDDLIRHDVFDCVYLKIWDENGHFYIEATDHDGRSTYEIRELTEKGYEYDDYMECYSVKSLQEIHNTIMTCNFYSRLPHFVHNAYGCKKYEYEKKGEKTA